MSNSDSSKETMTSRQSSGRELRRFSERLKASLEGQSIRGFAQKSDLSEAVLRNYLRGESYPTLDRLARIANAAKVKLAWLAAGEGPMREDDPAPPAHIDQELLHEIIYQAELMAEEEDLDPTPEQKAKFVSGLYVYILEEEIEEDTARRKAIRLVINNVA
jgi:transcriptional regulator with XRE-family HTH domain